MAIDKIILSYVLRTNNLEYFYLLKVAINFTFEHMDVYAFISGVGRHAPKYATMSIINSIN